MFLVQFTYNSAPHTKVQPAWVTIHFDYFMVHYLIFYLTKIVSLLDYPKPVSNPLLPCGGGGVHPTLLTQNQLRAATQCQKHN